MTIELIGGPVDGLIVEDWENRYEFGCKLPTIDNQFLHVYSRKEGKLKYSGMIINKENDELATD